MSVKESDLSACVRHMVTEYFKNLDGEKSAQVYDMVVACVEKPLLEVVMSHTGGNQTLAAQVLGINRNTLRKKMQQYGVK
jgi:Fis family transcriptional regulator, factor for inversion stimulation protein